jgi:hypothetical protein
MHPVARLCQSVCIGKGIVTRRPPTERTRQLSLPLIASAAISFSGIFFFLLHNGFPNGMAMCGGALWLAAFYFGATYQYWLSEFVSSSLTTRKRDWHTGQLTASCLLALSATFVRIDYAPLLPATLFLSYAVAKAECVVAGCCGSKHSVGGVQSTEIIFSGLLGCAVLVLPRERWIGGAAIAVFALMRGFSCTVQDHKNYPKALFLRKFMADFLFFLAICWLGTSSA